MRLMTFPFRVTHVLRGALVGLLVIASVLMPVSRAQAEPLYSLPPYELQVTPAEARATLNAYLRYLELRAADGDHPDARAIGQVSRLLRSYRSSRFWDTNP